MPGNVYKCHSPSCQFVLAKGKVIVFVPNKSGIGSRYVTENLAEIEELDSEVAHAGSRIYVDDEKTADTASEVHEAYKRAVIEEYLREKKNPLAGTSQTINETGLNSASSVEVAGYDAMEITPPKTIRITK